MSAPSISLTSSSSDSGQSGTSTPSSEFALSRLYLLSPGFIDGARLEALTSKLEKGYGDRVLLSVAHEGPFDLEDVQAAVGRLGDAIPDTCLADKQWVKVPEGKACSTALSHSPEPSFFPGGAFYLVDGAPIPLGEESSVEDFVKSHDDQVVLVSAI